jgi:hypothetical protein
MLTMGPLANNVTTQTEVPSFATQETQTDNESSVSFSTSEIQSQHTEPTEAVKTEAGIDNESSVSFSASDIKVQQTQPIEAVEAEDETEEEEDESSDESQPTSPCCEKEHLCTACGEQIDYSSEDDEVESKTPWQELCDGLVAFAGMQRE